MVEKDLIVDLLNAMRIAGSPKRFGFGTDLSGACLRLI
jgi:hypothetical protein